MRRGGECHDRITRRLYDADSDNAESMLKKSVRGNIIKYLWLTACDGVWSGNLFCESVSGENTLADC